MYALYFTSQSSRLSSAYTGLLTDGIGGYYFSMWFSRTTDNRTKKSIL